MLTRRGFLRAAGLVALAPVAIEADGWVRRLFPGFGAGTGRILTRAPLYPSSRSLSELHEAMRAIYADPLYGAGVSDSELLDLFGRDRRLGGPRIVEVKHYFRVTRA